MNEAQARKLETETEWNGKANVCIHCGRVPETFYIVTGHDHTDDSIRWCICRERYSQNEKHALLKENAALRAEVESLREDVAKLQQIAFLIGNIFAYGNFVAETFNERELEKLLRENGTFWESLEDFESQVYPAMAQGEK